MKFTVEERRITSGHWTYWAIGYEVPAFKEIARADTKARAEEIARLLSVAAAQQPEDPPIPVQVPSGKWWEIWK